MLSFDMISFELSSVFNEKRTTKFAHISQYIRSKSTNLNYIYFGNTSSNNVYFKVNNNNIRTTTVYSNLPRSTLE